MDRSTSFTAEPGRYATVYRHKWSFFGTWGWYCEKCGESNHIDTVPRQMGCPVSDLAAAKGE